MRWKTILTIDLILSLIVSIGLMMRDVFSQNKLMCEIFNLADCTDKDWAIQLLIFFVVVFIIIMILAGVIKSRSKGFGGIGKIKMPKLKRTKKEKTPELGKDFKLPRDLEKEIGRIKI